MASSEETKKKTAANKTQGAKKKQTNSKTAPKKNNSSKTKTQTTKKNSNTKSGQKKQTQSKQTQSKAKTTSNKKPAAKKSTAPKKATPKAETVKKETAPKVEIKEEIKEIEEIKETPVTEEKIIKDDFTFNTKAEELQAVKNERKNLAKEETVKPEKKYKVTSLLGLNLPTGKENKAKRRKIYKREALTFAIIFPIIDLFIMLFFKKYTYVMFTNNTVVNYIITLIIDFILVFCVTYLIDYIFSEDSIKKIK